MCFLLFHSTKPPSKELILIYRNRSVLITFVLKGNALFILKVLQASLKEKTWWLRGREWFHFLFARKDLLEILLPLLIFTDSQPKSFEISEVMEENGFVKVILNAGKLHGVVDGQYNVYKPHITEEEAKLYRCIDTIDVTVNDIDMLKSRGAAMYKRDAGGLKVSAWFNKTSIDDLTVSLN